MILAVIGFIVMFLAVFLLFIVFSRVMARKAQEKEHLAAWEEGHRRRSEATETEAWKANRKMSMK